ncbi:tRNA1(Val) (adenine(37)-N6)-methyltransferase [Azospirillum picis]|uniref:tRNA1(Val) A37 N6-methylase TrmN6 n=1 Tax=Azospirillum picis TaxID=488438 RepID=A0ABU0MHG4_9PROT|nr:methyltransferase [Azospirillum picis]MBP2298885.1 tRNA1(Val) A37 N6-methylase TrmN6 [Azospirillum picis]MDQ0532873.1 tRNA1(Val) A37 N6-methylase TrmN6 [Azospirillum picis]
MNGASESRPDALPPDGLPPDSLSPDFLLGGRVRLLQPASGYRAAIDPVFLAAATAATAGERVLDVGTGTGAAALCLAARVPGVTVVGLEQRADACGFARRNAALSGLAEQVAVVEGDLLAPPDGLAPGGFDRVMMNPPYLRSDAASHPPDAWKAAANVEGAAGLPDWVRFASRMLKPRGSLTMVHRADRIDDILAALQGRFGSLVLAPLWPRPGQDAKRLLVIARKGGRAPARLAAGLVVHGADGGYSTEAARVLRDAGALVF